MNLIALSLKGLRRDLRASDVRALFVALALAVAATLGPEVMRDASAGQRLHAFVE